MPVTIPGQWQNSFSPALFSGGLVSTAIVPPAVQSLPVTTAHVSGNWMLAVCAWVQATPGQGVSVSVDDDAYNRWEPLGAPSGDSAAAGPVRISLWYAPAARAAASDFGATTVMCAPTGAVLALGMLVLDVAGLNPWDELAFVPLTAFALAASSLSLTSAAPVANCLAITACAADTNATLSLSVGSGWTALTGTSISGSAPASKFALAAQWKTATLAQMVTWSSSGTPDLAAIMGAVVVAAAAPGSANPNWPIVITEAAPGAGPGTPPAQLNWQTLSSRALDFSVQQGQPYLLGGLQAATGALTLDDPDLAVSPPGLGVWAGLGSGTPLRVRAIWPSSSTPHYVRFNGFIQQAPTDFDDQLRGRVQSTVTDAYAYATSYLPPVIQAELLAEPTLYALWPCNDPVGSLVASNRAPGNQLPLQLPLSKYGTGATVTAFGQNSGALKGDSGSGMWSLAGVTTGSPNDGVSLHCADSNYPSISGGVTVEAWFQFSSGTPNAGALLTLTNSLNTVLQVTVGTVGTDLSVRGFQNATSIYEIDISAADFLTQPLFHVAIAFNRSSYAIYVNGGTLALATGSWFGGTAKLPPEFTHLWCNGAWTAAIQSGAFYNGYTAYVAVCGGMLPAARIAAHYQAGALAFAGDNAQERIERLLAYGGLTGRRAVVPEATGMPGGFTAPAGTDLTPMASMSTLGGTVPSLYTPGTPGFTPPSGTQVSSALASAVASLTPAVFDVAPTGAFFFYPRAYAAAQPVKWVLGDNQAAGEIPVQPDLSFPFDPGRVVNDIQLTQPDTGSVTVPGIPETASVMQYGDQSYQVTAYLELDASAGYTASPAMSDLANWVASVNYAPQMRATATVKASHTSTAVAPLAWPFVLGAAPGDTVTVNARPPTSPGAVISVTGRIVQVTPKLAIGDSTEGSLQFVLDIAPELNTLTCDSVPAGVLNGINCLGW